MSTRQELISAMTLPEKASLMSGANFWNTKDIARLGVPSIMLTDGPHGLRKQGGAADHLGLNASIPATCFPTAATLANSWDPELLRMVGEALGAEAAAENVSVLLGPGLNLKRNPLAGRNFEYFSEDPLLAGTLAAAMIRGIQSRGVAASVKHFAVNSQETHRMTIDEIVDERALHEVYLEAFRIAITQGNAWTVMSAYNRVNGTYANEHHELLTEILRRRWAFDGLVVTDWGGNNDRVAGLRAGNALEMPSADGVTDREIIAAITDGSLDEAVLDERVAELLTLIERTATARGSKTVLGALAGAIPSTASSTASTPAPADHTRHHQLAIEAASRSIVLATNPRKVLPLNTSSGRIAVIGDFAETPRYQGAGSSLVKPTQLEAPLDALRATDLDIVGFEQGFRRRDLPSRRLRARALKLARQADVVLLFLGLDESAEAEGVDRAHMGLAENQLVLTRELLQLGMPVVVVLAGGAPVELPFASDVDGLVLSYLTGQGGGTAISNVLTGVENPGGKLAETYPLKYEDVPSSASFAQAEATSEHRESIYVGYRYYDKVGSPVRFPFGHGLSYTEFSYSDLVVGARTVQITVTNTGELPGSEIVQLYLEAPLAAEGQFRAPRELAAFARVALAPGESTQVDLQLAEHAHSIYDVATGDWRVAPGTYRALVGASSRDIRLVGELVVGGETTVAENHAVAGEHTVDDHTDGGSPALSLTPSELPHYRSGRVQEVGSAEFSALIGRPLPSPDWPKHLPLTRDDIVAQTRGRGGFASFLYWTINTGHDVLLLLGRPLAANNTRFALDLPFRSIARMSGGSVNDDMLDGFLMMVNGHFFRGVRHALVARRSMRRGNAQKES